MSRPRWIKLIGSMRKETPRQLGIRAITHTMQRHIIVGGGEHKSSMRSATRSCLTSHRLLADGWGRAKDRYRSNKEPTRKGWKRDRTIGIPI
ncbi:hypothetical protein CR513_42909, partial [Mucuna pruriens]